MVSIIMESLDESSEESTFSEAARKRRNGSEDDGSDEMNSKGE